ncbi:hypothetical protein [Formosa maritima]|uniref:Uncharacterized protein n=1 Tax=Formosa maritima TaxID=2592046 RepID=A0A5D0GCM8_9FLAO|nr:hypothetical protein [Formosa maritima]TYA56656.1 hypothetical protein FVF61_05830 [Formosa maritima]
MKCIVTVRGHFDYPTFVVVDLDSGKITDKKQYKELFTEIIPNNKLGFTGIKRINNGFWTATWDRLIRFSLPNLNVEEVISHHQFSDVHGLCISNNKLLLANTNLDAIFEVDLESKMVAPFWFGWSLNKKTEKELHKNYNSETNYNIMTKKESLFHRLHINSVHLSSKKTFISYLGSSTSKYNYIKKKLGINRKRDGGLVVLNEKKQRIKHFKCEGLHDSFEINNELAFTQYFSNSLFVVNPVTLKRKIVSLEMSKELNNFFLTRGGYQINENEIVVGHTLRHGWTMKEPYSLIRFYNLEGKFLKKEIKLQGVVGIYEFCEI